MSEMKHTPGPWAVGARYGQLRTEVLAPSGDAIATVWTRRMASTAADIRPILEACNEGRANLALIAAAPDLLEALTDLLTTRDEDDGMDDHPDEESVGWYEQDGKTYDLSLTFGHLRRARTAIAKALGHDA